MKLQAAWFWESLENLPILFGYVLATRLWSESIPAGLIALTLGMGIGVLITRQVEPKLHRANHEERWINVLTNFVLFVSLAIPFIYYFRADTRWINWKTDLFGGMAAALLLTFVQSLNWTGPKARIILHGVAMLVAFPVMMLGLRYITHVDGWGLSIALTFLLTLFASLLIALIDYQEMYRQQSNN